MVLEPLCPLDGNPCVHPHPTQHPLTDPNTPTMLVMARVNSIMLSAIIHNMHVPNIHEVTILNHHTIEGRTLLTYISITYLSDNNPIKLTVININETLCKTWTSTCNSTVVI